MRKEIFCLLHVNNILAVSKDLTRQKEYQHFTIRHFRHRNQHGPHLQYQGCHHHRHRNLHHRVGRHCHHRCHLQCLGFHRHQCLCLHHLHPEHHHHRHRYHVSQEYHHYHHQNHQYQEFRHHRSPFRLPLQPQGIQPYLGKKDSAPESTTSFLCFLSC